MFQKCVRNKIIVNKASTTENTITFPLMEFKIVHVTVNREL